MKDAVYLVKNQQRIITYEKKIIFCIETNDDE